MIRALLIITLVFICHGETSDEEAFRFDYKFSKNAGGWLKLHQVPGTWSEARLRCHAEGGVLASPLTNQLRLAILEYVGQVRGTPPHTIFIGIHSTFSKGDYSSVEGVPLSRLPIKWAPNEPDNFANSENCLAMLTSHSGTMKDVKCTDVFPYVCFKKKTQALVINRCGTYDSGYDFEARTGSCYKFHRSGLPWSAAYTTCMAEGAHLVIINSDLEAQVIKELFAKNPESTIFAQWPYASIGTYDSGDGGYWMTIHGETPTEAGFDRWQPGEPNNGTQPRGEFCGVTHRDHVLLHDAPCDWIMPFICEKKPENLGEPELYY